MSGLIADLIARYRPKVPWINGLMRRTHGVGSCVGYREFRYGNFAVIICKHISLFHYFGLIEGISQSSSMAAS